MALEIETTNYTQAIVKCINFEDSEINEQIGDDEDEDLTYVEGEIIVYQNPFDNCQSFCVAGAEDLNNNGEDPETVKLILAKIIESASMKTQGVFDLRNDQLKTFIANITPWALVIHQMPYISTNKSEMTLLLVQLNSPKIFK